MRRAFIASPAMRRVRSESGQSTIEWVGLILIVSLVISFLGAIAGLGLPGAALAHAVASKIICATGLSDSCGGSASELAIAYGADVAEAIAEHAPDLLYEESMRELPVDYRDCREDACAAIDGADGAVAKTAEGLPATAFVHIVDCRPEGITAATAQGYDCSGARAGALYIQYWLYYPDSQTDPFGDRGYHRDDWESFQVRLIGAAEDARASSHHSYNYEGGIGNWVSDAGIDTKPGWGPFAGTYFISAGSHAGHVEGEGEGGAFTPGEDLVLIPIEPIGASGADDGIFAVRPPWLKDVFRDPEAEGT